jgi:hypothetical protein
MTSRLVEAMLADEPRLSMLYRTSPEFNHTVGVVERVLPTLLHLIADDAERQAEARRIADLPSIHLDAPR